MASLRLPLLPRALFSRPISLLPFRGSTRCGSHPSASISTSSFTWDDVLRVAQPRYSDDDDGDSSDLAGFFEKIRLCNRASETRSDFLPFVVEDQIVGYVHQGFADHLRQFDDVFTFDRDSLNGSRFGGCVGLHPLLGTPEDRTEAVVRVVKCLGQELIPALSGEIFIWRFDNILS